VEGSSAENLAGFSSETPRIFLAVPFSDPFKAKAQKYQEELKRIFLGVHWIPIENLHLTVKFFGETKLAKIDKILNALNEIVSPFPRMEIVFSDYGFFGSPRSPRVLFLKGESEQISLLAEKVLKRFPDEKYRPFTAHLTLGKFLKRQTPDQIAHNEALIRKWQESSSAGIGLGKVNISELVCELVLMETIWVWSASLPLWRRFGSAEL